MCAIRASEPPDRAVLTAFGLAPEPIEAEGSGWINRTWYVRSPRGERLVLQRVNPIFPPGINRDIDVLTRHLAAKGLPTPELVRTGSGSLWLEHEGAVWRVLSYVEGTTCAIVDSTHRAHEAGRALGGFHRAVGDLEHTFGNARLGVHDTPRHLEALQAALAAHGDHPAHPAARPLADRVLELAGRIGAEPAGRDRIVHGDPKISNIVFERGTGRALCLIDLDTVTHMPVALELGDALRSWCNPEGEDAPSAHFSQALFEAAVEGYAEAVRGLLDASEWGGIPSATFAIAVELAARFCADSLNERYFAWDRARYATASEHNRARARAQIALAESIENALPAMHAAVERAFARPPS